MVFQVLNLDSGTLHKLDFSYFKRLPTRGEIINLYEQGQMIYLEIVNTQYIFKEDGTGSNLILMAKIQK
jgi:hypothetical protein